jgi:hypothetical protein
MGDMEKFEEELKGAMRNIAPPADFAARTARRAEETKIQTAGIRPGVWAALAVAACLLVAVFAVHGLQDRRQEAPSGNDMAASVITQPYAAGPAFVVNGGNVAPYRGRTRIQVVWNVSQNAPEVIVEAFPWEN